MEVSVLFPKERGAHHQILQLFGYFCGEEAHQKGPSPLWISLLPLALHVFGGG